MTFLEKIGTLTTESISAIRANPFFAVLIPARARDRMSIPYRTFCASDRGVHMRIKTPCVGVGDSRRAPPDAWRAPILLAAALVLSGMTTHVHAADPAQTSRNADDGGDVRRQAQIATVYAMNPLLRDAVLIVTVSGSNATLVGKVGSLVEKELAEEIALSVDGIKHVDDLIGVTDVPASRPGRDVSFGQKIDDATTTASIRSKLSWGVTTSGLAIQVVTVRGQVRLVGTVYDGAQKDLIGHLAADTPGALAVKNDIVVFSVPPVTSGARADGRKRVEDARRPVSDAWITARIQSTFLLSPSTNRSAIEVDTSDGSVSLSGLAGSASARTSAIALAQSIRGVQKVDGTRLVAN
jgi:hyperosmotically inducible periplasmic protein